MIKHYFQGDVGEEQKSDILVAIGALQATVGQLASQAARDREESQESRRGMHRRLDEALKELSEMKTDVVMTKDRVERFAVTHEQIVMPAVEDWGRMKMTGIGLAGLLALGGVSIGGLIAWFSDQAVTVIRHWLRLP